MGMLLGNKQGMRNAIASGDIETIANATYAGVEAFTGFDSYSFNNDGSKFYTANGTIVYEYDLSVNWDITTKSLVTSKSFGVPQFGSLEFNDIGTKMFSYSSSDETIREIVLSTPWDINSGVVSGVILNLTYITNVTRSFSFSHDGLSIYIIQIATDVIYKIPLSSAWDITTNGTFTSKSLATLYTFTTPYDSRFFLGGLKLAILDVSQEKVIEFDLSSPYAISTMTYNGVFSNTLSSPRQIVFAYGKQQMLIGRAFSGGVLIYDL